ncbi:MAG: aquaporin [Anaerolineales bacterium]|nr:aquaporin [Anaerolineales bacterium]
MGRFFAELLGTFALALFGTVAIIVSLLCGGVITHVGIALTFVMAVLAMIYAFGNVSGAHLNLAVTAAFVLAGRLPRCWLAPYLAAQTSGALAASAFLAWSFPQHPTLGATVPAIADVPAYAFEVLLAGLPMSVVLHLVIGFQERGLLAGVAIGATVAMAAMFPGPVTGASTNPARSPQPGWLGPGLTSRST